MNSGVWRGSRGDLKDVGSKFLGSAGTELTRATVLGGILFGPDNYGVEVSIGNSVRVKIRKGREDPLA